MPVGLKVGPAPHQPTIKEVLRLHPFLRDNPAKPGILMVSQGVWDVQGDLVLPAKTDLIVPAGTALRFGEGSVLYTTGALN